MKRFACLALFLLVFVGCHYAHAAPQPKPPLPTAITFTQGVVTRTLQVPPHANCSDFRGTPINGEHGQRRFRLVCSAGSSGSWVQFDADAGPIYPFWVYAPAQCGAKPAPVVQFFACPFGTHGNGFSLTHDWTCSNGTWVATDWVPPWIPPPPAAPTPPQGACTPNATAWQAARYIGADAMPAKPAKGSSFVGPYGMTTTRVTDHTIDAPGQAWIVSWYNRFQAFNADDTMFAVYEADGFWLVFDAATNALVRKLQGPAADAELQWDANDPHVMRYLPTNGGRKFTRIDVTTGATALEWDFSAAVGAIFPNATRYWTKSEGSPTADGRYWCLWAESEDFSKVFGYVKLDIVNKAVVWSMANPHGTSVTDNVGCTPSGRWLVDSGTQTGIHTTAYATDGSGRTQLLSNLTEHGELGVRSDGHDYYIGPDYTAGVMYTVDVDTGVRRDLFPIYNNPYLGNNGNCANCAVHPSAKAFGKPGWAIVSTFGTPPANILLVNVEDGRVFGLGADYALVPDSSYWPEPHCTVNATLTKMLCSDNLGNVAHPLDVDVYRTDLPALPL